MFATSHAIGNVISERVTNTDGNQTNFTDDFAATPGHVNAVTLVTIKDTSGTGGYVDFVLDGASKKFTVPFGPDGAVVGNGVGVLFKTSVNTALAYDVSAALSTVIISVSGVKSGS